MADIALVMAGRVEVVESTEQKTQLAGAAITAGQAMYTGANGTWLLADGATNTSGIHLAVKSAQSGEGLTGIRLGRMDGYDLSGLAYNASVFLSNTAGALSTGSGTVSVVLGRVEAANATPLGTAPDKILHVACPI